MTRTPEHPTLVLARCDDRATVVYVTPDRERFTIHYCLQEAHAMARSTQKTILFATGKDGNKVRQWPVAVFNNDKDAKSYAAILRLSYRANDAEAVKALDPGVKLTDAGATLKEVKFSLVTIPYAPTPDLEDEDAATEEAPAS